MEQNRIALSKWERRMCSIPIIQTFSHVPSDLPTPFNLFNVVVLFPGQTKRSARWLSESKEGSRRGICIVFRLKYPVLCISAYVCQCLTFWFNFLFTIHYEAGQLSVRETPEWKCFRYYNVGKAQFIITNTIMTVLRIRKHSQLKLISKINTNFGKLSYSLA